MNYEQHDNLLFADWTLTTTPLSEEGQEEVDKLEQLVIHAYELASKDQIQAVLWIQKVACYDAHEEWVDEIQNRLLRDHLRARLVKLQNLRRLIQESPIPWIYVTEKDCCGAMFELMMACHRRFVFDKQTWLGFPELSIEQLPALGWLATQLQRQPQSYDSWKKRTLISAEEAVQMGMINAALSWKDWKRDLLPWCQRQIDSMNRPPHGQRSLPTPSKVTALWPARKEATYAKTQLQTYLQNASLRTVGIDEDLVDSAAHFMMQAPYETWLQREIHLRRRGRRLLGEKLVFFDISDAVPPLALIARILERGVRICFFAGNVTVLQEGLDGIFSRLATRFTRTRFNLFESQLSWFVGQRPETPRWMTMKFGRFREISLWQHDLWASGWAIAAQSMERQVIELGIESKDFIPKISEFFDAVYCVKDNTADSTLLYEIRSLVLQILVFYCQDTGETLPVVLDQLKGTGWSLVGSERYWQKFLEYRSFLRMQQKLKVTESIGSFFFDARIAKVSTWKGLVDICQVRRGRELQQGPGFLHRLLCSFTGQLAKEFFRSGRFESFEESDLYVADALGFPERWGSPEVFARRMGRLTDHEFKRGLIERPQS